MRANDATKYYLDKGGRRRLERDVGSTVVARLADKLNIAVVVADDGRLVTAYYRCERIRRP